jgi:hypothetical protein
MKGSPTPICVDEDCPAGVRRETSSRRGVGRRDTSSRTVSSDPVNRLTASEDT